jgi:hypothetical protein
LSSAPLVQSRTLLGHPGPPGSRETQTRTGNIVRTAADGSVIDVRSPRNGMSIHHSAAVHLTIAPSMFRESCSMSSTGLIPTPARLWMYMRPPASMDRTSMSGPRAALTPPRATTGHIRPPRRRGLVTTRATSRRIHLLRAPNPGWRTTYLRRVSLRPTARNLRRLSLPKSSRCSRTRSADRCDRSPPKQRRTPRTKIRGPVNSSRLRNPCFARRGATSFCGQANPLTAWPGVHSLLQVT